MASHDLHCSPEMCGACREEYDRLRASEARLLKIIEEAEHSKLCHMSKTSCRYEPHGPGLYIGLDHPLVTECPGCDCFKSKE